MEEYLIKGTSSKLIHRKEDLWKIESMYSTPGLMKQDFNIPYLFLESRGSKYLTFTYYLGSVQPQKLKLPIDKLIKIENND